LRALTNAGLPIFVITNQAIVNRNIVPHSVVEDIHRRMCKEIERNGGQVEAVIYCPHRPEEQCDCRKPRDGLLRRASREYGVDLDESYLIGDALSDVAAGLAAGCQTVLVLSGRGWRQLLSPEAFSYKGYRVARNLYSAASWIVRREGLPLLLLQS
jgi:D-glycero-D-manno-heptose 1,7-bisphosphate phosphatase